eukprot:12890066-Prorocentrum_lima.AAC.1
MALENNMYKIPTTLEPCTALVPKAAPRHATRRRHISRDWAHTIRDWDGPVSQTSRGVLRVRS